MNLIFRVSKELYYYLFNAHGDVVQLVDNNGNTVKNYNYDAFGNEVNPDANDTNAFRYCGEYFDKETATIYLRARYYDPAMGRFLSEDPIGHGLNWYTYCGNNPIVYSDPTGLWQASDSSLSKSAQSTIQKLTADYNKAQKAGDKAGMNTAHSAAEAVRALDKAGVQSNKTPTSATTSSTKTTNSSTGSSTSTQTSSYSSSGNDKSSSATASEPRSLLGIFVKGMMLGSDLGLAVGASMGGNTGKSPSIPNKGVNPNDIRFSQSSVNGAGEITNSMKANGWKGDPIDVVRMPDGKLTAIDNTRVAAARQAGIDVQANIHGYNDPLPSNFVDRFTTKGGVPTTWGDAINLRIGNQNATFRNTYPTGSFDMPKVNP